MTQLKVALPLSITVYVCGYVVNMARTNIHIYYVMSFWCRGKVSHFYVLVTHPVVRVRVRSSELQKNKCLGNSLKFCVCLLWWPINVWPKAQPYISKTLADREKRSETLYHWTRKLRASRSEIWLGHQNREGRQFPSVDGKFTSLYDLTKNCLLSKLSSIAQVVVRSAKNMDFIFAFRS